ncbi:hypothetical protein LP419_03900 [Massilia sp. H-1]|nr:hypothetical protein LP419_03900 [Massilia sp. H-1]
MHGVRKRHVVFASACAHYSIEWTLNQLGLGSAACTRIPCDSTGRMRVAALETRLRRAVAEGYCVSAIILAGGDTIDHIIDPIDEVVEMIDALLSTMKLTYRPFVYVDLVSGWIWRLFRGYDFVANDLSLSSADADTFATSWRNSRACRRLTASALTCTSSACVRTAHPFSSAETAPNY